VPTGTPYLRASFLFAVGHYKKEKSAYIENIETFDGEQRKLSSHSIAYFGSTRKV
jgi:hypothetical protein